MRRWWAFALLALAGPGAATAGTAPVAADTVAAWSPPDGRVLRFVGTLAVGGAAALAVRGHEDPDLAATRLHD